MNIIKVIAFRYNLQYLANYWSLNVQQLTFVYFWFCGQGALIFAQVHSKAARLVVHGDKFSFNFCHFQSIN